MDLDLNNKIVMVAAASQGLGYHIAQEASKEGAVVCIGSRDEEKITKAAESIHSITGNQVFPFMVDVTSEEDINRWFEKVLSQHNQIDALVVNTGGPNPGNFDQLSEDDWRQGYELVLLSAIRMIKRAGEQMKKQQHGSILAITSSSVKEPIGQLLLSNVFRSGLTSMLKSLANDWARHGIRVNNIVPGSVHTQRIDQLVRNISEKEGIDEADVQKRHHAQIPMQRYGTPGEFAKSAVFILSNAASYVTGETFIVDGGKMKTVW